MQPYKHRQFGTLIVISLGLALVLTATAFWVVGEEEGQPIVFSVIGVLAVCLLLFWSLQIELTADDVLVSFGIGIIRRRIPIRNIAGVRVVRNRWYYGWGIRLTPHGWLFNVSGLDAVELEYQNGRKFRIGTDDPAGLAAGMKQRCLAAASLSE